MERLIRSVHLDHNYASKNNIILYDYFYKYNRLKNINNSKKSKEIQHLKSEKNDICPKLNDIVYNINKDVNTRYKESNYEEITNESNLDKSYLNIKLPEKSNFMKTGNKVYNEPIIGCRKRKMNKPIKRSRIFEK